MVKTYDPQSGVFDHLHEIDALSGHPDLSVRIRKVRIVDFSGPDLQNSDSDHLKLIGKTAGKN